MANAKNVRIRNWDRFQHYSGRRPPWIKLHSELLDNSEFMEMSVQTRWFAMTLLLLAARTENVIPVNAAWLAGVARVTPSLARRCLAELMQTRFVEPCGRKRVASTMLDESYPSRARTRSASVSEDLQPKANDLVAEYVDHADSLNIVLPKQVKGAAAQQVGKLLREGIPPELIRKALRLLNEKGLNAASLPSLVVEAQANRNGTKGKRKTGWRQVRGSHGTSYVRDPEGTDFAPAGSA